MALSEQDIVGQSTTPPEPPELPVETTVDEQQLAQAQKILEALPQNVRDTLASYREQIEAAEGDTHTIELDTATMQELALASLGVIGEKVTTEGFKAEVLQRERRDNEASEDVLRIHADTTSFIVPENIREQLANVSIPDSAKDFISNRLAGVPIKLDYVDLNFTNQPSPNADGETIIGYDSVGNDLKVSAPKNFAINLALATLTTAIPSLPNTFVSAVAGGTRVNDNISKTLLLPNILGGVADKVSLKITPNGVAATFGKRPAAPMAKAA